jgi:uncharacterized membrane protein
MSFIASGIKHRAWSLKILVTLCVVLLFVGWLLNTPEGLLGKADAVGYAVCHRIDVRSFHLGDRTIPLCARCSGMYLGAVLGLAYQVLFSRRKGGMPPRRVVVVLVILVAAFGIDGLNSYMHLGFLKSPPSLYQPQNWLRLLTGTGMGIVIAVMIFPAYNQSVWVNWKPAAAIPGIRDLGIMLALGLILDLIVLGENPLVLYPLSLISAAGVLLLLTLVYAMVVTMFFRQENHFQNVKQMWFVLVTGFGTALIQIAVLDLLRYLFTGTWDGFHLG